MSKGVVVRTDGTEVHQERMIEQIDQAEQLTSTLIRYRAVSDGRVVEEQVHTMRMRLYFRHELEKMLNPNPPKEGVGLAS